MCLCSKLCALLPKVCWNEKADCACACDDCKCKGKSFYGLKWRCLSLGIGRDASCCDKAQESG